MNMMGMTGATSSATIPADTVPGKAVAPGRMDGLTVCDASAVSPEQFLSIALDEAIAALTVLDADRLEEIASGVKAMIAGRPEIEASERMIANRAAREEDLREVMARHRLLGHLLESTSLSLSVLQGLRRRNSVGGDLWVR